MHPQGYVVQVREGSGWEHSAAEVSDAGCRGQRRANSWVLSNCVLFGATDEVLDLELFLARAFPGKTLEPSVLVANAVEHGTVDELTVGEKTELVQHAKDEMSLYYWVKSMSHKFEFCNGDSRFQSALRGARDFISS